MSVSAPSLETGKTKNLLKSAVNNTPTFSRKGLLDRMFTAWFDRLVYPQIREDPEVNIEALQLDADSRIFTISSGGCNVLNYLSETPDSITVVDLNEAHVALLNLKLAALQHLDDNTLNYWENRSAPWGKKRIELFSSGFYRHGLLGKFIGLIHWTGKRLGYDISKVMQARTPEEQQTLFETHVGPIFETRLLKFLSRRPMVMYSLGIPPAQFEEMARESKSDRQGMHLLLKERARRLACDFPLKDNYFAWQAFQREYDLDHRHAIPRYLQKSHFGTLKHQQHRVHVHHESMTERLRQMPDQSLNAYLFLDAQDWMDEPQLTELWREVNRTAGSGAKVVFRTAGTLSPLEQKLPKALLASWQTDTKANQTWTRQDRSGIYGGVFVYTHRAANASLNAASSHS